MTGSGRAAAAQRGRAGAGAASTSGRCARRREAAGGRLAAAAAGRRRWRRAPAPSARPARAAVVAAASASEQRARRGGGAGSRRARGGAIEARAVEVETLERPGPDAGPRDAAAGEADEVEAARAAVLKAAAPTEPGAARRAGDGDGGGGGRVRRRRRRIKNEKMTYLLSAIAFTVGVTGLAFVCTYSRFTRHLAPGDPLPWGEIGSTLLFIAGAAFAMELWALWAHRALWHDTPMLWELHRSHHEPRVGPFEKNDVFAIVNAAPAIALIAYGFFNDGYVPGLCYGAGLGITVFGMLYMFVHDGLVHKRFAVGPIGEVPYLKRVAAAHKVHHGERFEGVPYGLFLGPWELEKLPGGAEEIERILQRERGPRGAGGAE